MVKEVDIRRNEVNGKALLRTSIGRVGLIKNFLMAQMMKMF